MEGAAGGDLLHGHPGKLALANLVDGGTGTDEALPSSSFAIHLDRALLDHPQRFGGGGHRSASLSRLAMASPSPSSASSTSGMSSGMAFLEKRWVKSSWSRPGRRFVVITGDDLASQPDLHVARVEGAGSDTCLELFNLGQRTEGEQLVVVPHQIVGDGHDLAEHLPGHRARRCSWQRTWTSS